MILPPLPAKLGPLPSRDPARDKVIVAALNALIDYVAALPTGAPAPVEPPPVEPPPAEPPPVVVPPPPPPPAVGAAELPRAEVDVSPVPASGSTFPVQTAAEFAVALGKARPGDEIVLDPLALLVGNWALPALPQPDPDHPRWVTIRTGGALPPRGTRAVPALGLPRLATPNAAPALEALAGASYWRLQGVEVTALPGVAAANALVVLGRDRTAQTEPAQVPHHLVLDRCVVRGTPALDLRRGVAANAAWVALVDSSVSECHAAGADSQALCGWNGPGPITVLNCYLEGAGENVMFGGADAARPEFVPQDITLRGCHLAKPLAWKGVWTVKNLLELKDAARVLVEECLLDGAWVDGQDGTAVLLKSVNQDGGAPWSATTDVTLRRNLIRNAEAGINIAGAPETNLHPVTTPARRITLAENLVQAAHRWLTIEAAADVTLDHNDAAATPGPALQFNGGVSPGLRATANRLPADQWGRAVVSADGHGAGDGALAYHAPGAAVAGNAFLGASSGIPSANGPAAPDAGVTAEGIAAAVAGALAGVRPVNQ